MKKIFFILSLLLVTLSVNAADLKVKSGNWLSIKKEAAVACVDFDYSNAKGEEVENLSDPRVKASVDDFVSSFNEMSTGLKMSKNAEEARYKLVFRVKNLELDNAYFIWNGYCTKLYGDIEVIDLVSESNVCTIRVKGLKGFGDYRSEVRLSNSFKSLAEKLINLK